MDALNLAELEQLARERLPPASWDYYASGAGDEHTLAENEAAFRRLRVFYRVLVDVSRRRLDTELLGQRVRMPIVVAPTAFHKLAHPEGEVATARAAGRAGTIMVLSTLSTSRVEDVVAAATGPVWFQLYVYKDRAATQALVERVTAAGCQALVFTVDAPLLGRRERDMRNRFELPPGLRVENVSAEGYGDVAAPEMESGLAAYFADLLDPALTFDDIEWLRSISTLPVIVKGVVRADDAREAVARGASGVVVSNHGGRQLDGSPATIDALPYVADAVGDQALVLLDGGVRRGVDVLKALALGARGVLVGRPILWGLAAGGEAGVLHALSLLEKELDLALALAGCPSVRQVDRALLSPG